MGTPGQGIVSRIDGALAFVEKLFATNPTYVKANPQVTERIKKIKEQNRNYLAHEYFNRDWLPMPFAKMAEWLAPTKLSFACSAFYLEQIDAVNLSAEQQVLLNELPDAMFRETVRDFMVNQQFRRDYWVKGARTLPLLERNESIRAQRIVLVHPVETVSLKVASVRGEVTMQEAVYRPVLDFLKDHQPKRIGEIEHAVKGYGVLFAQVLQAVVVLAGNGTLLAAQDEAVVKKTRKNTDRINAYLINRARSSSDINTLASPVTGGGISVGRFQQLFLLARSQGKKLPAEWAGFAWQILVEQNQRILKDGKQLEGEAENIAELGEQATLFDEKHVPILKALGVA
jgi:hypothetical protein